MDFIPSALSEYLFRIYVPLFYIDPYELVQIYLAGYYSSQLMSVAIDAVISRRNVLWFGDSMSLLDYWGKQESSAKRRKVSGDDILQKHSIRKEESMPRESEERPIDRPLLKTSDSPAIPLDGYLPIDDGKHIPDGQTELESSLPAIETNTQAIDEYETLRTVQVESDEPDLHQRMQNSSWQKGKSSIYADAFNLALETVLNEEAHLFNGAEMEVFRQWRELSYESQYL